MQGRSKAQEGGRGHGRAPSDTKGQGKKRDEGTPAGRAIGQVGDSKVPESERGQRPPHRKAGEIWNMESRPHEKTQTKMKEAHRHNSSIGVHDHAANIAAGLQSPPALQEINTRIQIGIQWALGRQNHCQQLRSNRQSKQASTAAGPRPETQRSCCEAGKRSQQAQAKGGGKGSGNCGKQ